MKYGWRWGKTTHFEDGRLEDTVTFDSRIKTHFAKVETALEVHAHFSVYLKRFRERRFGASEPY